jgi:hypothetical protein
VNFQPAGASVPSGYLTDTGAAFGNRGNGRSYGWNGNNASTTRDRNASNSPDQRYDTLAHLQKPELPNALWEIAVANGSYRVHVVSGDPSHTDSVFRTNVEGVLAVNGTPTTGQRWFEGWVDVVVSDGRLTIANAVGALNNKVNFIDIIPLGISSGGEFAAASVPNGRPTAARPSTVGIRDRPGARSHLRVDRDVRTNISDTVGSRASAAGGGDLRWGNLFRSKPRARFGLGGPANGPR